MNIILNNKKAKFNYEILSKYQCGIKLVGSEVKPLKNGKGSIAESYCIIKDDEIFITNMNINNSENNTGKFAHEPTRHRKLLLHKKEIQKIKSDISIKGLTLIPLKVVLLDNGLLKLIIGVCRGKKLHDKRQALKDKDLKREIERNN